MGDLDSTPITHHYANAFASFMSNHPELVNLPLEERLRHFRTNGITRKTMFFRDVSMFGAFTDLVLPNLQGDISLAFIGCSNGQEPYSFMLYHWNSLNRLTMDAYDINPGCVETSSTGKYQILPSDEKHLAFFASEKPYAISVNSDGIKRTLAFSDAFKGKIRFAVHDIFEAPLPKKYDAIIMRKVLCHYPRDGREQIVKNVGKSLNDSGWLFCESCTPSNYFTKVLEYGRWMQDLSSLGFLKQPSQADVLLHVYRKG